MGSYGHLYVERCPIFAFRDTIEPTFMFLFTRREFRRRVIRGRERRGYMYEPHDHVDVVEYATTSEILRDRLDALGVGRGLVESAFQEIVGEAAGRRKRWARDGSFPPETHDELKEEASILDLLDLDRWESQVREHILAGEDPTDRTTVGSLGWLMDLWDYADPRLVLRAVVDAMPGAEIELDVTDLVEEGWLDEGQDPQEAALDRFGWPLSHGTPAIVLAEGRTDIEVLSIALGLRRPHLERFVRFTDFDMKTEGGAGALVRTVRAFAAAGVANRIVAIFDNDTAGSDAIRTLRVPPLPANISLLQYPTLDRALRYPTLGPTGRMDMNVNGLACGIEMYLGDDILADEGEGFRPVQWTGFVRSLQRYQGELVQKAELTEKFRTKAAEARSSPEVMAEQDWRGLDAILDLIIARLGEPWPSDPSPQPA